MKVKRTEKEGKTKQDKEKEDKTKKMRQFNSLTVY